MGGVGYRVTVTPRTLAALEPTTERVPPRPPPHPGGRPDPLRLPRAATSGPRFEVAARRPRRRAGAGPGHPRHPRARRAGRRRGLDGDLAALVPRARRGQEDGRAAPARAAQPARPSPVLDDAVAGAGGGPAAVGDVREALAGLGYGTDEIREALRELDAARRRRAAPARRPRRCWGRGVRDEFLDPAPADEREQVEEAGLRPRRLDEFVGQTELKEHLSVMLEAARRRGQAADHLLFAGPPGLGKTTLAGIVAAEMGVQLHVTSGPALERAGDLAAILTKLDDGDVLFIDEIHRLSRAVEEILYPAMEDFQLDIVVGKGPAASSIRLTPAPLHPRRRHHPHRPHHRAAARPLRPRRPARLLRARASCEAIVTRAAGILGVDHRRRGRGRDRRPQPGHAPHRQPPAAPRAGLRRGAGRRRRSTSPRPAPGWPCSAWTSAGLDKVDRAILARAVPPVRRRPGRAVDAGHQRGRAARDGRGRVRAVPHPAGPADAHAARPRGHAGGLGAPRPGQPSAARRQRRRARDAPEASFSSTGRCWRRNADVVRSHAARPRRPRSRTSPPRGCRRRGRRRR